MARLTARLRSALVLTSVIGCAAGGPLSAQANHDWLTWGADPQRTGWARSETTLSKDNVSRLEMKWVAELDNPSRPLELSTITAPLVVENVATPQGARTLIYVVGSTDIVYALDAATGNVFWRKSFPNTLTPPQATTWLCPNSQNATPTIDKARGIIWVLTSDGKLRGLALADGADRFTATDFVTPFARAWSLNFVDGAVYTTLGRGCGRAIAEMAAMDVTNLARPTKASFNTSTGRPAGAWGKGGPVLGPRGMYIMTADGPFDPTMNAFGNTFMIFSPKTLQLVDYYTPDNWEYLNQKDYDLGSGSPLVFPFRGRQIVTGVAKEGVIYFLDDNSLGGANHMAPLARSPRYGNDQATLYSRGIWGNMATWETPAGERWLYLPMWGPPAEPLAPFTRIHGHQESGSIMAFRVDEVDGVPSATPMWISESMSAPDSPVIANGVVFSVSTGENSRQRLTASAPADRFSMVGNASLRAFDAITGDQLYHSGSIVTDWTHFSGMAISNGRIYFTTNHNRVYSFGLR